MTPQNKTKELENKKYPTIRGIMLWDKFLVTWLLIISFLGFIVGSIRQNNIFWNIGIIVLAFNMIFAGSVFIIFIFAKIPKKEKSKQ